MLAPIRIAYGLYALAVFVVAALSALLVTAVLPGLGRRRAVARVAARAFLWLAGMPLEMKFAERLPAGQCVLVSNHASYLDGVVFTAALPPRFGYVIKRDQHWRKYVFRGTRPKPRHGSYERGALLLTGGGFDISVQKITESKVVVRIRTS